MEIIGLDLHKRECQLAIKAEDGTITDRRISTTRAKLHEAFGPPRPPAKILLESSTESEWVAQLLEGWGHTVIVADPNFAPMYAQWSRRIKTDKRDARALLAACELGAYREAHRLSDTERHRRATLGVREALVRTRTRYIALTKTLVRRDGLRVPSSTSRTVGRHVTALDLSAMLGAEVAPLLTLLEPLNAQIAALDATLKRQATSDPLLQRLMTVPQIGVITASAFVSTLDTVERFRSAHRVEAYLGLVPSEDSSAERRHVGHITKAGNTRTRSLLVEAAWGILRSKGEDTRALRSWGQAIAARRGQRIAVVALARRLAGILYAIWRDDVAYDPTKIRAGRPAPRMR